MIRRTVGATNQSALPLCLVRSWYRSFWQIHQNTLKTERWLKTANTSWSFSMGKLCLTDLVALDDGVTALVDKG